MGRKLSPVKPRARSPRTLFSDSAAMVARLSGQPVERVRYLRSPTAAKMKVEAIQPEVTQVIGDIQVLFDARQAMDQNRRDPGCFSSGPIKPAQQPASSGCKRDAIQPSFESAHRLSSSAC